MLLLFRWLFCPGGVARNVQGGSPSTVGRGNIPNSHLLEDLIRGRVRPEWRRVRHQLAQGYVPGLSCPSSNTFYLFGLRLWKDFWTIGLFRTILGFISRIVTYPGDSLSEDSLSRDSYPALYPRVRIWDNFILGIALSPG